ncbi:MAG: DUF3465 domain-containing protein [Phycisphaerales bacterium JB063]
MANPKGKKITIGSVLGIVLAIAVVVARQQGWLPTGDTTDTATRTAQTDHESDAADIAAQRDSRNTPAQSPSQETRQPDRTDNTPRNTGRTGGALLPGGDGGIGQLFASQRSDVVVTASGIVKKILPDDNDGSRHQKFIVTLSTGQTVLIAHNIDLAERVPCDEGDVVTFRGEYEWSGQGGVIHWTHHDPAGRHQPGWIEYEGVRYQ